MSWRILQRLLRPKLGPLWFSTRFWDSKKSSSKKAWLPRCGITWSKISHGSTPASCFPAFSCTSTRSRGMTSSLSSMVTTSTLHSLAACFLTKHPTSSGSTAWCNQRCATNDHVQLSNACSLCSKAARPVTHTSSMPVCSTSTCQVTPKATSTPAPFRGVTWGFVSVGIWLVICSCTKTPLMKNTFMTKNQTSRTKKAPVSKALNTERLGWS